MTNYQKKLDQIITEGGCFHREDVPTVRLAQEAEEMYKLLRAAISYQPDCHKAVLNSRDVANIKAILARIEAAGWCG